MRFGCFFQETNSREPQVDSREQEKASLNALMHRMHTKSIFAQYSEFARPFLIYFCNDSKNPTRRLLRQNSAVQLMFWHSGGLGRVQEVPGGGSWRCGPEWPAGSPVPGPRMTVNHRNQFSSRTPQRTTFVPIQATRVCPGVSSAGCFSCFFGLLSCFGAIPIFIPPKRHVHRISRSHSETKKKRQKTV